MKKDLFQKAHAEWLRGILQDPKGQVLLQALSSLIPVHENSPHVHLFSENKGMRRGYEICLHNLIALSEAPKVTEEVKVTYGVQDRM